MRHQTLRASVLVVLFLTVAGPVSATTPGEAADGLVDGLYVAADAEAVDEAALRELILDARGRDLDLAVVVLGAEGGSAVGFADAVADQTGGTVLVFTPTEYGTSSNTLTQSRLERILDDADEELSGPDLVAGVEAFVEAAVPSPSNWGLILGVGALVVLVVGVGGRMVERRATAGRREKALRRRHAELSGRADQLADPMIDLSTRVELAGTPALAEKYREASETFTAVRSALEREPSVSHVDRIEEDLVRLEAAFEEIRDGLPKPGGENEQN